MTRNLFEELKEGFQALQEEREGKITLKKRTLEARPPPRISSSELVSLRKKHNLSQPVFAHYLRTNTRTLQNWEQGRATPNNQAAVLIKMVEKYPDMIERMEEV